MRDSLLALLLKRACAVERFTFNAANSVESIFLFLAMTKVLYTEGSFRPYSSSFSAPSLVSANRMMADLAWVDTLRPLVYYCSVFPTERATQCTKDITQLFHFFFVYFSNGNQQQQQVINLK